MTNCKQNLQLANVSHMSLVVRKPAFRVSDQVRHNRVEQPQKMARGLKFWIYVVEGLYYPYSENKGADQLRSKETALICVFVFTYAKNGFLITRLIYDPRAMTK